MRESVVLNDNAQESLPAHCVKNTITYNQGYALRGIATILILFSHSINEYECYDSMLSNLLLIPAFGTFGCSLFFFMSGYGMFHSLGKRGEALTPGYLFAHLKKILIPVAVVYGINSIVLPYTLAYNDITINHSNLFLLNLPEGTDIWFIKIILFDYITTFLLFKLIKDTKARLIYLAIIQLALIAVLYLCKLGGYWYISNLCFVLGALHSIYPLRKRLLLTISVSLFVAYYLLRINGVVSAPIRIVGNLAFCAIISLAISRIPQWPQWLIFLGKNSLLYYLLNIPIMWVVSSNNMHFLVYFVSNMVLTTIAIFIYNRISRIFSLKNQAQ